MHNLTALVTIVSILVLFWASFRVGKARGTYKIKAPATTGDPNFERIFRSHQNMVEWMPIYLPALWLFSFYVGDVWAALVGLVWIAGRVTYVLTYSGAAEKRGPGFAIQASATGVLVVGAAIGIAKALIAG